MPPEKTFIFQPYYFSPEERMCLKLHHYSSNNRIALQLLYFDLSCKGFLPYATLTVNIPNAKLSSKNCVFLDTNNCKFVERLLIETLHVAKLTNHYATSGFCIYPEVELNIDKLTDYIYFTEV